MSVPNWLATFRQVSRSFPGIRTRGLGAKTKCSIKGEIVSAKLVVSANDDGEMSSRVIDYARARCDITSKYQYGKRSHVISFDCSTKAMVAFTRYLEYASTAILGSGLPKVDPPTKPMSMLLSHVLLMLKDEYDRHSETRKLPALATWSSVLRFLSREPVPLQSIRRRVNISRRVLKIAIDTLSQLNWIELSRGTSTRKAQLVNLTEEGEALCTAAENTNVEVEASWSTKFGDETIAMLRSSLVVVADQVKLELPYYCVGYGVADQSITGGSPHGNEWPNVMRDPNVDVSALPLSTLLSKVLAAFTIDYESHGLGGLGWACQCLVHMSDSGMTLGDVRKFGIVGNGKSAPERHLSVVLEAGKLSKDSRKVYLTPKSRRSRDSYPALISQVEHDWSETYGAESVANLRAALLKLDQYAPEGIPDYPDPSHWLKYPQKTHHQPIYAFKSDPSVYEKWGDVATTCYAGRAQLIVADETD